MKTIIKFSMALGILLITNLSYSQDLLKGKPEQENPKKARTSVAKKQNNISKIKSERNNTTDKKMSKVKNEEVILKK